MSRSFAPSPIAIVRARGTAYDAAHSVSATALPTASTISPSTTPDRMPSATASRFARHTSIPSDGATSSRISWNPPETTATTPPRSCTAATSSCTPGVGSMRASTRANAATGTPRSASTRERRLVAKSTSPRIAASVAAATSGPRPASSAMSSMTSLRIRVESASRTMRKDAAGTPPR